MRRRGLPWAKAAFGLAAASVWCGCVTLLSLKEDDFGVIADDTCAMVRATCDGQYDLELVWGTERTCEDIVAEASGEGGSVSADELGACFDYATCVEVLDCLADYNIFRLTGAETCRPSGDACLERCFPDNCLSPHRCCTSNCTGGVCD